MQGMGIYAVEKNNALHVQRFPWLLHYSAIDGKRNQEFSNTQKMDVVMLISPWRLTGISAQQLSMCLFNSRAIEQKNNKKKTDPNLVASRYGENLLRRPSAWGNEAQD